MKRIAAVVAIVAALALGASAQSTSKPNQVYPDAKVALILPDDAETSVDTGTWMATSESTGTSVMFEKYDVTIAAGDINRSVVAKAAAAYGVKGFKFVALGNPKGLAFGYGRGKYTSEDGTTMDGFFGLLDNTAIKGKTFFFGFLVPSLDDPDIYDGIKAAVDDMVVAK
jgi:hypothetical protein